MWTHPGIDVFDELDSRAGLQPAHLIKWNPFLDEAAAVHELESCEDLVIGVLDHFLENEPSPNLHPSTSLGRSLISSREDCYGSGSCARLLISREAASFFAIRSSLELMGGVWPRRQPRKAAPSPPGRSPATACRHGAP